MTSGRPELSSRALKSLGRSRSHWGQVVDGAEDRGVPTAVATWRTGLEIGIASNQAAMMTAMICSSVPMTLSTVRTARERIPPGRRGRGSGRRPDRR